MTNKVQSTTIRPNIIIMDFLIEGCENLFNRSSTLCNYLSDYSMMPITAGSLEILSIFEQCDSNRWDRSAQRASGITRVPARMAGGALNLLDAQSTYFL
jgi:hypothetical protein